MQASNFQKRDRVARKLDAARLAVHKIVERAVEQEQVPRYVEPELASIKQSLEGEQLGSAQAHIQFLFDTALEPNRREDLHDWISALEALEATLENARQMVIAEISGPISS